ncbi:MAG: cytidyltransferase, partial [Prevotellaceae bacterium]|nr:cytidyltransferase [Prevotellaceae bacterium]
KAIELWQVNIPAGDKEKLARTLFCFENPPGTKYISGSQDSLGIVLPGLNKLHYDGGFWPSKIESELRSDILSWIEKRLWLIPLYPRHNGYDVLSETNITPQNAQMLSTAANECWNAIKEKNTQHFGQAIRESFEAQIAMFPHMVNSDILNVLNKYKGNAAGWKLSGAGGGGYFIFVSEQPIENALQVRIRQGE